MSQSPRPLLKLLLELEGNFSQLSCPFLIFYQFSITVYFKLWMIVVRCSSLSEIQNVFIEDLICALIEQAYILPGKHCDAQLIRLFAHVFVICLTWFFATDALVNCLTWYGENCASFIGNFAGCRSLLIVNGKRDYQSFRSGEVWSFILFHPWLESRTNNFYFSAFN